MPDPLPRVDIVGIGLNAMDTLIRLPHFPAFNCKLEFTSSEVLPGGQIASAIVACAKWGLTARYAGKIGDDTAGRIHREQMSLAGVEAYWMEVPNCQSQTAFILVDQSTGERTILWKRDARLAMAPEELDREWVVRARLLHVDGHDCAAAAQAARWAREAGIPVTADVDNLYPGIEGLLEHVDYLICSREFTARLTGETELLGSLALIAKRFGCRMVAATLGAEGVVARAGTEFLYHPAFDVCALDTTGAGDIFHAGFAFALLQGWDLPRSLAFSSAAAGLSCLAFGARGGIAPLAEIHQLVRTGRHRAAAFSQAQLEGAGLHP